jgi:Asp-tRNA(Asn)/Glu-tRNA(Gln) amidotransferase A subunit family amidase
MQGRDSNQSIRSGPLSLVCDGLTQTELLQDSFNVTGKQSTIGFVSYLNHDVAASNAPLLDTLLELGAVLYIKTNVPQTMLVGTLKGPNLTALTNQ